MLSAQDVGKFIRNNMCVDDPIIFNVVEQSPLVIKQQNFFKCTEQTVLDLFYEERLVCNLFWCLG